MREHLREYIEAVVDAYIMEDFADATRPTQGARQGTRPTKGAPQNPFNIEQLKNIQTLDQVQAYVNSTLGNALIGKGQGRSVYKLGGGKVIKVAIDQGGQGQNQAEATVCSSSAAGDLFLKPTELGPNHMWIITPEAAGMTEEAFERMTGLNWGLFRSALAGAFPQKLDASTGADKLERNKQNYINASNNPFFSRIVRVVQDCKYEPGDIAKLDSWGIVGGKPVIIDSGFTEAVNQAYYKKSA